MARKTSLFRVEGTKTYPVHRMTAGEIYDLHDRHPDLYQDTCPINAKETLENDWDTEAYLVEDDTGTYVCMSYKHGEDWYQWDSKK